jgi:MFS family permease
MSVSEPSVQSATSGNSPADPSPTRASRGVFGLLTDPAFGGIFWGKFLDFSGIMIQSLVTAILAFEATGSALAVAVVTGALFAPQLVLSPWSGAAADRGHAAAQIVWGRVLCAVGAGVLAAWAALVEPAGWGSVAVITSTSLLAGVGLAIGGAAINAIVPQLVTRDEMPTAMSLNTVPMTVGRVAGPALGAAFLASFGPVYALLVAVLGHLVLAATVAAVRIPRVRTAAKAGSIRAAWRHVLADRPLLLLLVAITLMGFGTEPTLTLAPSYAESFHYPAGPGTSSLVGILMVGFGSGAGLGLLVSIVLSRRIAHERQSQLGFLFMIAGSVACAMVPWWQAAVLAFSAIGVGFVVALSSISTLVQLRVPDAFRGRVMALWMMGYVGTRPATAVIVGTIADLLGERIAFTTTAAVLLVTSWWCRPSRLR